MSKLPKLAITLALAGSVAGCASQKSAESHADYVAQTQTVRTEGAERVTVLEFGSGVLAPGSPRRAPRLPGPYRASAGQQDFLPDHGPLLKATITETGPITTTTKSGTDVHTDAESQSKTRLGPGFWGWVGLAFVGIAAGVLAWKFRAGLLGGVLRVLGRG